MPFSHLPLINCVDWAALDRIYSFIAIGFPPPLAVAILPNRHAILLIQWPLMAPLSY